MTRVLVTGAGGPAGRALISQLIGRGMPVIATDTEPVAVPGAEAMHVIPAASDPTMVSVLLRIVTHEKVDLVIPVVSDELPQIAAARAAFGAGVDVVIAGPGPVLLAHDKLFTAWQLRARGVAVPSFGVTGDFEDAASAFTALGSSLVVKSRVAGSGRGVRVADHPGELDWDTLSAADMLQQFVPGTDYTAMVYRPPAGTPVKGTTVVLEKTQPERVGNPATVTRLPDHAAEDVERIALAAVRALGLVGPADVHVRRDADGRPLVLAVNAGFGAHSAAAPELLTCVLAAAGRLEVKCR